MVRIENRTEQHLPLKKKVLNLVYPCYICCSSHNNNEYVAYGVAARAINHVREAHGYYLPSRRRGIRRPKNDRYDYQSNMKMHWDEQHYACTSCWYHADSLDRFIEHVKTRHTPSKYEDGQVDDQAAEDDYDNIHVSNNEASFVYNGNRFEQKTVNTIFKQINDITALFKDILKM